MDIEILATQESDEPDNLQYLVEYKGGAFIVDGPKAWKTTTDKAFTFGVWDGAIPPLTFDLSLKLTMAAEKAK